ncbi:MAG: hypothetical protein AAF676_06555 [Pseudomonadota bacterium]
MEEMLPVLIDQYLLPAVGLAALSLAARLGLISEKRRRRMAASYDFDAPIGRALDWAAGRAGAAAIDAASRVRMVDDAMTYLEKTRPELLEVASGGLRSVTDATRMRLEAAVEGFVEKLDDEDPRKPADRRKGPRRQASG